MLFPCGETLAAGLRAEVLGHRFCGQPAAPTHHPTAAEIPLWEYTVPKRSREARFVYYKHTGKQNTELKTFPRALTKRYSNRTQVCSHTVMCLPAHDFEVSLQATNSREGKKTCNSL